MRRYAVISGLCLAMSCVAHADTVTTFNLNNLKFASGAQGSGTVTIDTTTGLFTTNNAAYTFGTTTINFNGPPSSQGMFGGSTQYYEIALDSTTNPMFALDIDIPGPSLVGYAGGNLCSTTNPCGPGNDTTYFTNSTNIPDRAISGSLGATTPEPSSLVLLGTGLLGALGAAKRRFFTR